MMLERFLFVCLFALFGEIIFSYLQKIVCTLEIRLYTLPGQHNRGDSVHDVTGNQEQLTYVGEMAPPIVCYKV